MLPAALRFTPARDRRHRAPLHLPLVCNLQRFRLYRHLDAFVGRPWMTPPADVSVTRLLAFLCPRSTLLASHHTAVLRHDSAGQEMLMNLLLRNYLHYNLYDQV